MTVAAAVIVTMPAGMLVETAKAKPIANFIEHVGGL